MGAPVVIEVALNGLTTPERNAAVPRLPADVAADALRCLDAGAGVVHSHTHDPVRGPREAAALYHEAYRAILERRPEAILYPTMGVGATFEERYGHHEILAEAGAIRCAVFDPGSVNLGASAADGLPIPMDFAYTNTPRDIRAMAEVCWRWRLGPSIAVFEPGFLRVTLSAHRAGSLPPGALVKLYFSEGGYLAGGEPIFSPPPLPEALALYATMLEGCTLPWAVAVLGGSLLDSPLARLALERGGHLRVGLEDHMDGEPNAVQVERAAKLCAEVGRPVASPEEAARILALPER